MTSVDYHLGELAVALDASDHRWCLPQLTDGDRVVVDIGCGIGQTFVALNPGARICIGIDIDEAALAFGGKTYGGRFHYVRAGAEAIPLAPGCVDLVIARVSLPYTNIPVVVREVRRLLQEDGRFWMVLHGRQLIMTWLREAINMRKLGRIARLLYILINGYVLKLFGFVFPFVDGQYESWQDTSAMKDLLQRSGFVVVEQLINGHQVLEATIAAREQSATAGRTRLTA